LSQEAPEIRFGNVEPTGGIEVIDAARRPGKQ
jgi:hypothetical protein